MENILKSNINSIAVLIYFENKYKRNIKNILNWNMKTIIHSTWGSQLLEKRWCSFANANDSCRYVYELIATEISNTPMFYIHCLKVGYLKYFSLVTNMQRFIATIKRNRKKYFKIAMISQLSVLVCMVQEADSEF